MLFENRVSARKFASTTVDQFAGHGVAGSPSEQYNEKGIYDSGDKAQVEMLEK